jgi:hypothetical protein
MRECREGRMSADPQRGQRKVLAEARTSEPICTVGDPAATTPDWEKRKPLGPVPTPE